ncbi:hypothetical protein HYPP_02998 [Hyphomicrobium sp. ghe19]|nr:hypothetical protein HYPP_02998 [Hyphomicrobium sp. ghe19]
MSAPLSSINTSRAVVHVFVPRHSLQVGRSSGVGFREMRVVDISRPSRPGSEAAKARDGARLQPSFSRR